MSTVIFGLGGGVVGNLVGRMLPAYYRAVFDENVDPIPTGTGLGVTQGAGAGIVVGLAIVVAFSFRGKRQQSDPRLDHAAPPPWAEAEAE